MGSSGPYRGELGEVSEGSIRTFAFIRWLGHVQPNTASYAVFSIMDFFPVLASIISDKMPTNRPIDGVDKGDVLFGKSTVGHRDSLLSFIGPQLVRRDGSSGASISPTCIRLASSRKGCLAPKGADPTNLPEERIPSTPAGG